MSLRQSVQPLDRDSPMPLWAQLEAELRRRLHDGEFGERFPTDAELTADYGVSRHTARHAVDQLNRTGLLRRERGIGTSLNHAEFEQSLGALYSLFHEVESTGVEQRSQVLEVGVVTDEPAARCLDLPPDAELFHLARLRLAGDAPLAIDRAWLPLAIARPLLEADFGHTALYDELDRTGGHRPTSGFEHIHPVIPTRGEQRLLGMGRSGAAFRVERLGRAAGRAVEWRITLIRGDRFSFVAEWSAGARQELRLQPSV